MNTRHGDWLQLASGGKLYPLDPRPEEILIDDIAHALAHQCRFAGHCRLMYTVAEHSVRVSLACDPADALWGLLHDASEAFLCDVPRPIKLDPMMAPYRKAETRLMEAICMRFGLGFSMPASVHAADETLLATEARDLMAPLQPEWSRWLDRIEPLPRVIVPWSPATARLAFMARFYGLTELAPMEDAS